MSSQRRKEEKAREREVAKRAPWREAMREAGAPDGGELGAFDGVLLRQSIMGAGNPVPGWIAEASAAWLASRDYGAGTLRPFPATDVDGSRV